MKVNLLFRLIIFLFITTPLVSVSAAPADGFKKETSTGKAAAEKLTQITGIAISPLAGIGGVGAFRYWKAKPENRPGLSWYAQPWFFVPALLLVAACMAKDSAGPFVPTSLKKPLDLLELFENKISGIIATGAVVPMALEIFEALKPTGGPSTMTLSSVGFAALDFSWLGDLVMVPLALLIYATVWLFSHTIHVLILVSPFTTVDTALKGFRAFILGSLVVLPAIDERAGVLWSVVIVLVSVVFAPWAFRTVVFGSVFAWDIASRQKHRFSPKKDCVWAFSARRLGKVPHRSLGRVSRNGEGELVFIWRSWLIFAPQTETLTQGHYIIGQGLIHSEILRVEEESTFDIFNLPPRCNGHEQAVAGALGLTEIRPIGLRAFWAALSGLIGGRNRVRSAL